MYWTPRDEDELLRRVRAKGRLWVTIASRPFADSGLRRANQCSSKYNDLFRNQRGGDEGTYDGEGFNRSDGEGVSDGNE